MNATLSQRDILQADREAVQYARQPSILHRLFGKKLAPVRETEEFAQAPLITDELLDDNRLILERLMEEASELVGVELEGSAFQFAYLEAVYLASKSDRFYDDAELTEGDEIWEPIVLLMRWIDADRLPITIRKDLAQLLIRVGKHEEHVSMLSQTRWERLNMWSSVHE